MKKSTAFERWNNYIRKQNEADKDHEENLLPCPFCGGEAFVKVAPPHEHYFVNLPPYSGGAFIECRGCTCAMSGETSEKVIAGWNRRTQPEQPTVDPIHATGRCYCRECLKKDTESCPMVEFEYVCPGDTERTLFTANYDDGFCNYGKRKE